VAVLAFLLRDGSLSRWEFMGLVMGAFFLASAGASSAYLTVSEVFPMETRALAIALFYAVGTAIGGISGPLLFGQFIHSGSPDQVATGFLIGAAAMAVGGVAELFWGVRAEGQSLENIAKPLTAEEADAELQAPPVTVALDGGEPVAADPRAERIRQRATRRRDHDRAGLRRYRPGPGHTFYSPGMLGTAGTASRTAAMADLDLDREIEAIVRAFQTLEAIERAELERRLRATSWGPGRFGAALHQAVEEGSARRVSRHTYGPA
jgi:MFS family permease